MKCVLLLPVFFYCSQLYGQDHRQGSREGRKYLHNVIHILEANYFFAEKVNFKELGVDAYKLVEDTPATTAAYKAVRYLLDHLYEKHSGFLIPDASQQLQEDTGMLIYPTARLIDHTWGYLKLPAYFGPENQLTSWSERMIHEIRSMDSVGVQGWVIDLRENTGGNMFPMIAALSPLLPEGAVLSNRERNGDISTIEINNGCCIEKRKKITNTFFKPSQTYILKNPGLPIAVLIGGKTGSSGEITSIALRSCANVRFFGDPTAGVPTGNRVFMLPDKAMLYIVCSIFSDNNGKMYYGKISPDQTLPEGAAGELVPAEVAEWITGRKAFGKEVNNHL